MTDFARSVLTDKDVGNRLVSPLIYLERHRAVMDQGELDYMNSVYTFARDEAIIRGIDVRAFPRRLRANTRLYESMVESLDQTSGKGKAMDFLHRYDAALQRIKESGSRRMASGRYS